MRLDEFPKQKIALHFACKESNMFATNCACHLRCSSPRCPEAIALCEKYKESKGCRFVLLRGGPANTIATLKRVPTAHEAASFDLSHYPATHEQLRSSPKWSGLREQARRANSAPGPLVGDLLSAAGPAGRELLRKLEQYSPGTGDDQKHCRFDGGSGGAEGAEAEAAPARNSSWRQTFLSQGLSIVALSYQAPRTLLSSMRTWNASSLLSLSSDRIALLNAPYPQDLAIAAEHGFRIVEPSEIPNALVSKPNVLTIGAAFYYALKQARNEYVLFLENDFRVDPSLSLADLRLELVAAMGLLDAGAELVRLQSRSQQGCGTFKSCDHGGIHLQADNALERRRNWFAFYCPMDTTHHQGLGDHVSVCLRHGQPPASASASSSSTPRGQGQGQGQGQGRGLEFRCFTSWDSNWSLNAVLVKRSSMLNKKYPLGAGAGERAAGAGGARRGRAQQGGASRGAFKSIADIGLEQYENNDGFETVMSYSVRWMRWRVPLCLSYRGVFQHVEVETGA